ncbi:MAG: AMP-dependent synthetase/ligase [Flavobacteriales bacterium AspAUS03]
MNSKEIHRLFDILPYQLVTHPLEDALVTKTNGYWENISTQNYIELTHIVSRGLLRLNLKKGDHVIIISSTNRSEWNILDIGLQQVGAISVPIYPTNSDEDNQYIFQQTKAIYCFVSDQTLYEKIQPFKDEILSLREIYCFDTVPGVPNWKNLLTLGRDENLQRELEQIKSSIQANDIVTLIYTSGTTGTPKGVMLSHQNILSNIYASSERLSGTSIRRALSFLPCCHIFERMILYFYQYHGISIYFSESLESIEENAREIQPHIMTAVPRLLEKIYTEGTKGTWLKRNLFRWSIKLAERYEPYQKTNLQHRLADLLIFKRYYQALGGKIQAIILGSAALSPQLNRFFHAIGLPIIEGYGLTETAPVIAVNGLRPADLKVGTVGKPIKGIKLKIAKDGEICIKGPNVMKGYFKNPERTAKSFDPEGYFLTGDIGALKNGFLSITDRKKEIFKTSGGKYIAPQILENLFKKSHFIEQIMVVGEGEKMPCALIQPDFSFLRDWMERKGLSVPQSDKKLILQVEIIERISQEIETHNQTLGQWERIKKFALTPEIWSIQSGHLTPTLKLRRKIIQKKYYALYEEMYGKK